ncbi:MAG: hypothetical protein K2P81_06085 [Bacteriovoracaceae bacterium]|nr:hypothetical protein [Bacteriovoracaceae bacterium]
MDNRPILIIVPRLPPSINGVGDYALELAKRINQDHSQLFEFLVSDPSWKGENLISGFPVHKLESRDQTSLNGFLKPYSSVFLHYVGYGYAKRGSPVWLVKGLGHWLNQNPSRRLYTMFHELYAFGPVWTSQFWTSPLQKQLAQKLMLMSTKCATSKQGYAEKIEKLSKGKHTNILVSPVFSNIGEPQERLPYIERDSNLIIFGSPGPKNRIYEQSMAGVEKIISAAKIKRVIEIGQKSDHAPSAIGGIKIEQMGTLPSPEISKLLSHSKIGFINYPTEYLSKSGIFAAYCSHGLLTVATEYKNQKVDQVIESKHYMISDSEFNEEIAERISGQAFKWYQEHNLKAQAQKFYNLLN